MADELENLIQAMAHADERRSRLPRGVFKRLQLIATLLRAESPPGHGPRLLWRGADGKVISLAVTRSLLLGRDVGCELVLTSRRISKRHCTVRPVAGGGIEVEDLGSTNGTCVNGAPIRRWALHDGDMIELGGVMLVYAG